MYVLLIKGMGKVEWSIANIAISLQLACAYNFEAPAIKAGVLPWYRAVHKKHQLVLQVQVGVLSPSWLIEYLSFSMCNPSHPTPPSTPFLLFISSTCTSHQQCHRLHGMHLTVWWDVMYMYVYIVPKLKVIMSCCLMLPSNECHCTNSRVLCLFRNSCTQLHLLAFMPLSTILQNIVNKHANKHLNNKIDLFQSNQKLQKTPQEQQNLSFH